MADWSAANTPGPVRPTKDRCWVGRLDPGESTPTVVYCRTRKVALAQIEAWTEPLAERGRVLIGFDFPFGYPDGSGLPGGRPLCRMLGKLIKDDDHGRNNRFEIAANLNRMLYPGGEGPFWGRPASLDIADVSAKKPKPWPEQIPEFRIAERALRGKGIQSVWKLAYPASVGSQVLMGMSAVQRLLARPAFASARLWPFETAWADALGAVTIAEIWPNLFYPHWQADQRVRNHTIRDAGQIAATLLALQSADRDGRIVAMLAPPPGMSDVERQVVTAQEGWIVDAGGTAALAFGGGLV